MPAPKPIPWTLARFQYLSASCLPIDDPVPSMPNRRGQRPVSSSWREIRAPSHRRKSISEIDFGNRFRSPFFYPQLAKVVKPFTTECGAPATVRGICPLLVVSFKMPIGSRDRFVVFCQ
jgi:hypothetical protein